MEYKHKDNGGLIGLKAEVKGKWLSGVYNSLSRLHKDVQELDGKGNIYIAVNRIKEDTKPTNSLNHIGGLLGKDVFSLVTALVFDIDSDGRGEGVKEAGEARDRLVDYFYRYGFPAPLIGFSGRGWHVQYRCRIKIESYELFKDNLYQDIKKALNYEGFDMSVRNISRVMRLYGTINLKNGKRATCLIPPNGWDTVKRASLELLVEDLKRRYPPPQRQFKQTHFPRHQYPSLIDLFVANGLYLKAKGYAHEVVCPWAHEHSGGKIGGTYILTNRGYEVFYCHHAHCNHRRNKDVYRLFGVGRHDYA